MTLGTDNPHSFSLFFAGNGTVNHLVTKSHNPRLILTFFSFASKEKKKIPTFFQLVFSFFILSAVFIEYLLCAKHYSRHYTCINEHNRQSNFPPLAYILVSGGER